MRGSAWLAPAPPALAVEIASRRITVVGTDGTAATARITAHATEPLPAGAVVPALAAPNVHDPQVVAAALARALDRTGLGARRRVALVVPDSIARVALLPFETVPERAADLDALVRWQARKAAPFALDDAQLTYFPVHADGTRTTMAAVVARRDVVAEYEAVAASAGLHAGVVDLASFNIVNAIIAAGGASTGDWLLVHLAAEATTLTVMRGGELMFYRHRTAADEEPLGTLVHQTAMYHEDRLGGGAFARVWLAGDHADAAPVRAEVALRLGVPVDAIDLAAIGPPLDAGSGPAQAPDAVAAGVGILLRDRVA